MTCNACGEKPKKCGNCNKDFPRAVIEINNPESLILLRKVSIPASMGTEEQVPAAIGKYHNVILKYEANKHVYLYSSDGIPTLLEMDVPQEVWDSIDELQEEIDEIKNSPDVVDIVDTYADLESYDTSELGDKDVIRVLNDETHDGESTYYRWNLSSQTWTFIGGLGPYYTKSETDTLLDTKADKTTTYTKTEVDTALATKANQSTTYTKTEVDTALATKQNNLTAGDNITIENNVISADDWIVTLTSDDYDYPDNNPDGVAVWSLPTGMYRAPNGVKIYNDSATSGSGGNRIFFVNSDLPGSNSIIYYPGANITLSVVNKSTGSLVLDTSTLLASQVVDLLTSTATEAPLSANQGKVLKDMIDALPAPPTVVQTIGTSTTDVMSQDAVTNLIFTDDTYYQQIAIGYGAKTGGPSSGDAYSTAVGFGAFAGGTGTTLDSSAEATAIGAGSCARGKYGTAIGRGAKVNRDSLAKANGGVSIGSFATAYGTGIAIGGGPAGSSGVVAPASANGDGTIAIGIGAKVNNLSGTKGAIALGAGAVTGTTGVMSIDTSDTSYGYNNSNYRLLTGLYDPQSAHDAATKGYVDSLIAALEARIAALENT